MAQSGGTMALSGEGSRGGGGSSGSPGLNPPGPAVTCTYTPGRTITPPPRCCQVLSLTHTKGTVTLFVLDEEPPLSQGIINKFLMKGFVLK